MLKSVNQIVIALNVNNLLSVTYIVTPLVWGGGGADSCALDSVIGCTEYP